MFLLFIVFCILVPRGTATVQCSAIKAAYQKGCNCYAQDSDPALVIFSPDDCVTQPGVDAIMVKDIYSGTDSSYPNYLTAIGDTLFFQADDGTHGYELWKTDGTEAGTVMVKDIRSGSGSSASPFQLTAVGGTLFFQANDGTHGIELWKSDGTVAGTVMVKDIRSGASDSSPNYLTAIGDTLFFQAYDGTHGYELWKSDGTEANTVMVKDIRSGSGSSYPYLLTAVGNTLFFQADDGNNGRELWKTVGGPLACTGNPIITGNPIEIE